MTEAELVELWEERAAIIEEGCGSSIDWRIKSEAWRRRESERIAYWDIKRKHAVERMPKATSGWRLAAANG